MQALTPLALPPAPLKLKRQDNKVMVQCLIRRKYLVLTPEEWVRQHLISFLVVEKKYPIGLIASEMEINFNGLSKRCDYGEMPDSTLNRGFVGYQNANYS